MRRDWLLWTEDTETPRMRKYGKRKTTQIVMAAVPHVTAWAGRTKYHGDGFLLDDFKDSCTVLHKTVQLPDGHKHWPKYVVVNKEYTVFFLHVLVWI